MQKPIGIQWFLDFLARLLGPLKADAVDGMQAAALYGFYNYIIGNDSTLAILYAILNLSTNNLSAF